MHAQIPRRLRENQGTFSHYSTKWRAMEEEFALFFGMVRNISKENEKVEIVVKNEIRANRSKEEGWQKTQIF